MIPSVPRGEEYPGALVPLGHAHSRGTHSPIRMLPMVHFPFPFIGTTRPLFYSTPAWATVMTPAIFTAFTFLSNVHASWPQIP
ncbi:unnamed protein product [Protopolystoma xenopodis]|uniref:Uncharacterized protein n=1 Tax=Protopolystoma xenopodis TaxID=117903 RepID=A0A3S5CGN9_9PLAT|nr:unnamed protein product [Protopolystoma xenopodis]